MDVVMVDLVSHLFHGQVYTHYTPFTLLWDQLDQGQKCVGLIIPRVGLQTIGVSSPILSVDAIISRCDPCL
jgi:hypothetical protein